MEQDWDDDRRDEPIDEELQGKLQGGGSQLEYFGSEPASGMSSGTEGEMAAVTLFSDSIISPKFEIAYASGIPSVTQPDNTATSTPAAEGLVVVTTELPSLLAARKPVRDKKGAGSTNRHGTRPRTMSPAEPLKTACVSLPLPDQSARPSRATSPRLRRAAAVAASQRLERWTSTGCHRVTSEKSVSDVSATEPLLSEPTTVPKKKAVVPATKQKSPEFIELSTSSSEFSDDSVTPLAASRGLLPSHSKKAALPKPARARPSSSPSASRASLPARAPANMGFGARGFAIRFSLEGSPCC